MCHRRQQLVDIGVGHVQVKHPARAGNANTLLFQMCAQSCYIHSRVENHHIGLWGFLESESGKFGKGRGDPRCLLMIVPEPVNVLRECMDTGSREYPGLAHAAADHLAPAPRRGDALVVADQQGPHRAAQAFGEAQGNRVKTGADVGDGYVEGNGRIEYTRTVEMSFQAAADGELAVSPR
jgi:hypothetical protein